MFFSRTCSSRSSVIRSCSAASAAAESSAWAGTVTARSQNGHSTVTAQLQHGNGTVTARPRHSHSNDHSHAQHSITAMARSRSQHSGTVSQYHSHATQSQHHFAANPLTFLRSASASATSVLALSSRSERSYAPSCSLRSAAALQAGIGSNIGSQAVNTQITFRQAYERDTRAYHTVPCGMCG